MSELALKLIRENIEKHQRGEDATFLDLGNSKAWTKVSESLRPALESAKKRKKILLERRKGI